MRDSDAPLVFEEGVGAITVEIRLDGSTPLTRLILETHVESLTIRPKHTEAATVLSLCPKRRSWTRGSRASAWRSAFSTWWTRRRLIVLRSTVPVDQEFTRAWAPNLYFFAGERSGAGF